MKIYPLFSGYIKHQFTRGHYMRITTYKQNEYTFKEYAGNFQKIKYDVKKNDYFVTYNRRKFYFSGCLRVGTPWTPSEEKKDKNLIGTWQEGYCVYKLVSEDIREDFSDTSRCKVVYCPPAI